MLLVVASTLLVGARSQATTPPVGLVPIGGGCMAPEDCETQQCYFDEASQNSICVCNEETNAGCEEGKKCGFVPDLIGIFPPPICLDDPFTFLPIGAECQIDQQCESQVCFFIETGPPVCACNEETNAGCEEGKKCGYFPDTASIFLPPSCLDDPVTFLPLGAECTVNEQCESRVCFFIETGPDVCACNEDTNAGCSGGETCGYPPDTASIFLPPTCLASNGKCEPWSFQNGRRRSLIEWKQYSS